MSCSNTLQKHKVGSNHLYCGQNMKSRVCGLLSTVTSWCSDYLSLKFQPLSQAWWHMQEAGGPLSSSPFWSVQRVLVSNNRKQTRKIPAPLKNASMGTKPKHLLRSSRNNQELIFASSRLLYWIYSFASFCCSKRKLLSAQSINLLFLVRQTKVSMEKKGPLKKQLTRRCSVDSRQTCRRGAC